MDNKKLLIGGAIALVVIGLIIGVVIYIRKMGSNQLANTANASSTANSVPNPGNSFAPGQNTPAGRIPVRQFPTKDELIALAVKKNWDKGNEAPAIAATYDENKGTWQRGDWRFIITGNNPITAKAFKGANETFNLSYRGKSAYTLS